MDKLIGKVEYNGSIENGDSLILNSKSLINGYGGSEIYSFFLTAPLKKNRLDLSEKIIRNNIPDPNDYINDFEHVLTHFQVRILDSIVRRLEKSNSIPIQVITLGTNYTSKEEFPKLVALLIDNWLSAKKIKVNGIVIFISIVNRTMQIALTDKKVSNIITDDKNTKIINNYFAPSFKEGNYYKGMLSGLNELFKVINKK